MAIGDEHHWHQCDDCRTCVGSAAYRRNEALENAVRLLVKEADMRRDTEDQWWSDDWTHEVEIEDPDVLAVLHELIPEGRTF